MDEMDRVDNMLIAPYLSQSRYIGMNRTQDRISGRQFSGNNGRQKSCQEYQPKLLLSGVDDVQKKPAVGSCRRPNSEVS